MKKNSLPGQNNGGINLILKLACFALIAYMAAGFVSCTSTQVKRVGAEQQRDLSGKWSANDVREIARKLIDDCLASPRVNTLVQDWKRAHRNQNPACVVGNFKNSSSEHIDTNILARALETAIMNSGKLDFVAGGAVREQLRGERIQQAQNASEATAAAIGNETGAAFMLSGDVKAMLDQDGNKSFRNYFVDAQLTNVETGRIVWQGQAEVTKEVIRPKSRM
ncbi:MAG: penicillin-binding protein activator LpoB [Spirochaetaceae bacterium]|jgi:uncharacterized protein (TIGR02722 family)|nr:penicillin-binding protein activator LpoB [Spirochaetaceae bacterium]